MARKLDLRLDDIKIRMAEQMAALGCVAVVIDGRGTPYRSRDFQLAVHGRIEMCGDLPSHVQVLRSLAGSRPWMDLDRVGIVGGSGGGVPQVGVVEDDVATLGVDGDLLAYGLVMIGQRGEFDVESGARTVVSMLPDRAQ